MPAISEGVFLRLEANEAREIFDACDEMGLERSGEGVKALLLSLLRSEDDAEESPAERLQRFMAENPEMVLAARAAASQGIRGFAKFFK